MERKQYFFGLFNKYELVCEESDQFHFTSKGNNEQILVEGRKSDYSMKLLKRKSSEENYVTIDENGIEKKVTRQINEDGSRWEGDWYDEKPFGFGSYYDGEGNRMYSGFVFEGKKVAYGLEYFADSHTVDYCGNFMDDKRHGWGTSYDRNGNKLYEGDWVFGRNSNFEDVIVLENENKGCVEEKDMMDENAEIENKTLCMKTHNLIKELIVRKNSFNTWKWTCSLDFCNYPNLEKIVVQKESFKYIISLRICNNDMLKMIDIGDDNSFVNVRKVVFESL